MVVLVMLDCLTDKYVNKCIGMLHHTNAMQMRIADACQPLAPNAVQVHTGTCELTAKTSPKQAAATDSQDFRLLWLCAVGSLYTFSWG